MKRLALLMALLSSFNLFADVTCFAKRQELKINNAQVLLWKSSTKNQYHNRGHVTGTLLYTYPDKNGHDHFQVQIGENNKDTIEVIYNQSFGPIPPLANGASFEACGDYITSNADTPKYPSSPDGAILHWVHKSSNEKSHDSGFLIINGTVYGLKN